MTVDQQLVKKVASCGFGIDVKDCRFQERRMARSRAWVRKEPASGEELESWSLGRLNEEAVTGEAKGALKRRMRRNR